MLQKQSLESEITIGELQNNFYEYNKIPYNKFSFHNTKNSRDSNPKPSSHFLDSLCPNYFEYLSVSQPRISVFDLKTLNDYF